MVDHASKEQQQRRWRRRYVVPGIIAFVLLIWGGCLWQADHALQAELDAVRADGYPAEVDELYAYYPEPTDPHAGPALAEALSLLVDRNMADPLTPVLMPEGIMPRRGDVWSDVSLAVAEQWLETNRQALDRLHEASSLGRAWFPIEFSNPRAIETDRLAKLRYSTQLLHLEALTAAQRGESDVAFNALMAMWNISIALRDEPMALSFLVSKSMQFSAAEATEQLCHELRFTEEQLRQLMQVAQSTDVGRRDVIRAMAAERAFMHWAIQASGTTPYNEWPNYRIVLQATSLLDRSDIKHLRSTRESMAYIEGRTDSAPPLHDPLRDYIPGCLCTNLGGPLPDTLMQVYLRAGTAIDVTVIGLAAIQFHRKHDRWPHSLAELVPNYLPSVPRDRYRDESLQMRSTQDGLIIYSVGTDGDDHGGRELNSLGYRLVNASDNDMTFTIGNGQRELWPEQWTEVQSESEGAHD